MGNLGDFPAFLFISSISITFETFTAALLSTTLAFKID